jgi:hypothetical protein
MINSLAVFAGMRYTETAAMLIHQGFCCTPSESGTGDSSVRIAQLFLTPGTEAKAR